MMDVRPDTLIPSSDSKDVSLNPAVPTPVGIVVPSVGSFPTLSAHVVPPVGSFPPVDPVVPVPVAPGIVVFVFVFLAMFHVVYLFLSDKQALTKTVNLLIIVK
jgi:hypothetical protein